MNITHDKEALVSGKFEAIFGNPYTLKEPFYSVEICLKLHTK